MLCIVYFLSHIRCCEERELFRSRTLSRNYLCVFLICSCRALPLSLFLSAMCSPQGAGEVDCFHMHGCERKIQHPFICWDTHGWLSLCEEPSRNGTRQSVPGSVKRADLPFCVHAGYLLVWRRSCIYACVFLFQLIGTSEACVCQCSCMWDGCSLRDQNKAREHDRKSLNTRPLKNAGGQRTQKQVR